VAGFSPPIRKPLPSGVSEDVDLKTLLPVGLDHLALIQSHLVLHMNDRQLVIPLEIRLQTAELGRGILKGQVELSALESPCFFSCPGPGHTAEFTVESGRVLLQSLSQLGALPKEVDLSGAFDLTGQSTFQLTPPDITRLSLTGRLTNARLSTPMGALENLPSNQGTSQPASLTVTADDPDSIKLDCGPFQISGPIRTVVRSLAGQWSPLGDAGWKRNAQRPLKNAQFCAKSRKTKIITAEIH
jgi:hypothetical protein